MMCTEEEKCLMIVKSFISVMDNSVGIPSYDISYDAVMDWFGRSICGRSCIISFGKMQLPKCQHRVDEIVRIPRVTHRLLKQMKNNEVKKSVVQQENNEEGDSRQHTPDNPIRPNLEELIKAPKKTNNIGPSNKVRKQHWTVNSTDLEFVEIKGSLQYEHTFIDEGTPQLVNRTLEKIVLGYSDEIRFIAYVDAMPSCRVNLFKRFRNFT